ncbi:hypothetical protein PUV47_02045 [Pseudovibrio exalbescens]|uniref:hypothetical protein n=1 Tax=Pseudovibrio exalbescens TaxID=197461 RepID=UPI00236612DD|nr:hypothetical protein [Pseudovibrio exalbescens]MDD7908686.1 hypothetical protein [Pseudovibrio exalbescens]
MATGSGSGWLRMDISLGNIITIGGMLVGMALGWGQLQSKITEHTRRIDKLEQAESDRLSERVVQVQLFAEIRADIKYLRQAIERLERDPQP